MNRISSTSDVRDRQSADKHAPWFFNDAVNYHLERCRQRHADRPKATDILIGGAGNDSLDGRPRCRRMAGGSGRRLLRPIWLCVVIRGQERAPTRYMPADLGSGRPRHQRREPVLNRDRHIDCTAMALNHVHPPLAIRRQTAPAMPEMDVLEGGLGADTLDGRLPAKDVFLVPSRCDRPVARLGGDTINYVEVGKDRSDLRSSLFHISESTTARILSPTTSSLWRPTATATRWCISNSDGED